MDDWDEGLRNAVDALIPDVEGKPWDRWSNVVLGSWTTMSVSSRWCAMSP